MLGLFRKIDPSFRGELGSTAGPVPRLSNFQRNQSMRCAKIHFAILRSQVAHEV